MKDKLKKEESKQIITAIDKWVLHSWTFIEEENDA